MQLIYIFQGGHSMLILADARFPERVKKGLRQYGEVVPFASKGIVYEAISGHPDIFFCKTPSDLVAAPNTPPEMLKKIHDAGIKTVEGEFPVGATYPDSARYNAFAGSGCLVHRKGLTDRRITETTQGLTSIFVGQGYTRCNLTEAGGLFITSDRGIENALQKEGKEIFYIDPSVVKLPGQKHGFFGGCTGFYKNIFFMAGSARHFSKGAALVEMLTARGVEVCELYDGPLWDGGSILFLDAFEKP